MLSQRSYQIGSEQGILVLKAVVIDRRYQWVVTLEPLVAVGADDVPVVPRKVVRTHRPAGGSEERYGVPVLRDRLWRKGRNRRPC
jgi:hypothetical protein